MPQQVQLFLSTVSAEFLSYRDALRHDLDRPNVTVKVQEDFIVTGTETLDMLDDYIQQCNAVIHLVGDMTGAMAQPPSVALMRERYQDFGKRLPPVADFLQADSPPLSYTQWEAWLALYHQKPLIIAVPAKKAKRYKTYQLIESQRNHQQQHLARLAEVERYPGIRFANADRLAVEVLRSKLQDILAKAGDNIKPLSLPETSIGKQFMGRDNLLADLAQSLGEVPEQSGMPVTARVLSGLGGIGKTRLALEYAWLNGANYSARLFAGADTPVSLQTNLANLAQGTVLNLPEQSETDELKKRDAVIHWLNRNPGWLLILDNVDNKEAATAVSELIPKINGGHLLVTSRLSKIKNVVNNLQVSELEAAAARDFLLIRTLEGREQQDNDKTKADELAEELGYLPLALEQAGAYIDSCSLSFEAYLKKVQLETKKVLAWYDPDEMQYPRSVAVTWQTSFNQLNERPRNLLQRLSWLSPAPIPYSLLDVTLPGAGPENDVREDLAEIRKFSLVSRSKDNTSFTIHKLVQEVTRQQADDPKHLRLQEMLAWLNAGFVGDPMDVRDWPVLEPLTPHALALVQYADVRDIADPTGRLINQLGLLFLTKALYDQAEPLMRQALSIDEASYGQDHPNVARDLNNLAQLLQDTNRLAEAEPLMRRAVLIFFRSYGAEHPSFETVLGNYYALGQAMGWEENQIVEMIKNELSL